MTIAIHVRNYRRAENAEFTCSPIGLLVGANGSSKTSICEAIQAALTGTAIAKRLKLPMKEVGEILHTGAAAASVQITGPDGEAKINWPECKLSTIGANAPHASVFAAGVTSIDQIDEKDRPAALEPYLKAKPTEEELTLELKELRFKDESIAAIWKEVGARGWDAAAAGYETKRRDASRDWTKVTGTSWGSDKATRWHPEGWREELDDVTVEVATETLQAARQVLEAAVADQAVDVAETKRLRDLADLLDERREAATQAQIACDAAGQRVTEAEAVLRALPSIPTGGGAAQPCPHCQGLITFDLAGAMQKAEAPPDPAALKAHRLAKADADGALSNARGAKAEADRALGAATAALRASHEAAEAIEAMGDKAGSPAEQVDTARATVVSRENELGMIKKNTEAATLYRAWLRSDHLVKVLAPSGLRKKKLGKAVELFNSAILAPLCETAGFAPVTFNEDLVPSYGGRPYTLLSGGHLYRMRAILQVAQAKLDGSSMVVLDAADICDSPGRAGIFNLLIDSELPAVVAMTTIHGARVPDLAKSGLGVTMQIVDGRTRPYETEKAAA